MVFAFQAEMVHFYTCLNLLRFRLTVCCALIGHAACVFQNEIWVTGGRSDLYQMYSLAFTFKNADVWHSADGGTWTQVDLLLGDFYAQNSDVVQPGIIAPW